MRATSTRDRVEQTVRFITANRKMGSEKTGWNFNFGHEKIIIRELPQLRTPKGFPGKYRFIVKRCGKGRDSWIGAYGSHALAPIALKIAFEMAFDGSLGIA